MFMTVADHPALSDASTYSYLPAAYNTLYQLARIEPMERLLDAIDVGLVSPGMTLAEARALAKAHGIDPGERPKLPKGTFTTLLMDPPWRFDKAGAGARSSAESQYPTLSLEEIADLELPKMASDAHLYFWCPTQFLSQPMRLSRATGSKCAPSWRGPSRMASAWAATSAAAGSHASSPLEVTCRSRSRTRLHGSKPLAQSTARSRHRSSPTSLSGARPARTSRCSPGIRSAGRAGRTGVMRPKAAS